MTERTQRLRDPVHGLIVFRGDNQLDRLAWALIETPEFQRLRRIRQLGVSDFVFPSATHTRFAHSVGVFHTARTLIRVIEREIGERYDPKRAEVAVIAALLHDLGHGPLSHAFQDVEISRGVHKPHEQWSAEIIRNPNGRIRGLLEAHRPGRDLSGEVANLLEADDPTDIYHAVVSSAFDADRLDYLRRDRLMTGTGAGAIDFDWLMEQVRVRPIEIEAPEALAGEDRAVVPTFCFEAKALPAAEQFLLARYTLHEQVYFHKTTRCVEHMIDTLLRRVAEHAARPRTVRQTGLEAAHPLIRFFAPGGATLDNYLALDDAVVTEAIHRLSAAPDQVLAGLARRLRDRDLYKTLDLRSFGHDEGRQAREARRIDRDFAAKIRSKEVIKDEGAAVSIYTRIGGDEERAQKRLHILDTRKGPVEITEVSPLIGTFREKKKFTRYYFEHGADRNLARQGRGEHDEGA